MKFKSDCLSNLVAEADVVIEFVWIVLGHKVRYMHENIERQLQCRLISNFIVLVTLATEFAETNLLVYTKIASVVLASLLLSSH